MVSVMIYGAGMAGRAIARLLGTDYEFLGFLDSRAEGEGIYRPEMLPVLLPDCVMLGVQDEQRQLEMRSRLAEVGFRGKILSPGALQIFDPRCATMRLLAGNAPEGDVAELGVFRGSFAYAISKAFPDRTLHLFDTFEGFDGRDLEQESGERFHQDFSDTSAGSVQALIPSAVIHKGWFPETFAGCENLRFAFVSIDADLYAPTKAGLELFWPRLSEGGCIMVHDCLSTQFPDVKRAVDEFCGSHGIIPFPVADIHGSVGILRQNIHKN